MKINKSYLNSYLIYSFIIFLYLITFFYLKSPFWGLMDDATSIRLSMQFSKQPLITTIEWLAENNKNGMFRPFFVLQQFIQYFFYDLFNPFPTYALNILIVLTAVFNFSKLFIKKNNLLLFYTLILLWPYTYDWLIMPTLNEKIGLLFLLLGLLIKKNSFKIFKIGFGLFAMLMKLNILIFLPLVIYFEKSNSKKFLTSLGMLIGLVIQTIFFFKYPNSYYNTGLIETISLINFLTIQNLIIFVFVFLILIDIFIIKNSSQDKFYLFCILTSMVVSLLILNLRNSSFGYLGAVIIFPISLYIIFFIRKFNFNNSLYIFTIFSLILSNSFFLNPRLDRWNDIGKIINLESESKVVYFCDEGRFMLNIWDIEINNVDRSFFSNFEDTVISESKWLNSNVGKFKYIEYIKSNSVNYVIDPYCQDSVDFYNKIINCKYDYLYKKEIYLLKNVICSH